MDPTQNAGSSDIVRFQCPQCQKVLKAPAPKKPVMVTCPKCQARFRFGDTPALPALPVTAVSAAKPRQSPPTPVPVPTRQAIPSDAPKRSFLPWIVGGVAVVLLLGIGLFFAFRGKSGTSDQAELDSNGQSVVTPPVVMSQAAVVDAMNKQVVVAGKIERDLRTQQQGFNSSISYLQWKLNVNLENKSTFPIEFGNNLLLCELNANASMLEGVGVFPDKTSLTNHSTYGMLHNWESGGTRWSVSGNNYSISYGAGSTNFGSAQPGKTWPLNRLLEQGTWMREELRVKLLLVLPEARVRTTKGTEKFRILAYFAKSPAGPNWQFESQRVLPLEKEGLQKILSAPDSTMVMRSLAANFLAESVGKEAAGPLVAVAQSLHEGDLLATCLDLLTNLKDPTLGAHAMTLLLKTTSPNGIRSMSARYLGVVRHEPAWETLKRHAKDSDRSIASASISALGAFGDPKSVDFLLELSKESKFTDSQIAASLVSTKSPKALEAVQNQASQGSDMCLDALVNAGLPETFDFFVQMGKSPKTAQQRNRVARGLKASGKEKALPVLLEMLERTDNEKDDMGYGDETVRMIADLNLPAATPKLIELAGKGNVRAVRALAGSKNETARAPLQKLAATPEGPLARAAIQGLVDNWSSGNDAIFTVAQNSSDKEIVRIAKYGLERSQKAAATEALFKTAKVQAISLGQKAKGMLDETAKEVVYEIRLTAGKTYVVDMISADTATLDPYLKMANPAGIVIAENDDGGEGLNSRITLQAVATGAYRIAAMSFGASARGAFTLEVRER